MSFLALQSSRWGSESWLLCFVCLSGVCCGALPRGAMGFLQLVIVVFSEHTHYFFKGRTCQLETFARYWLMYKVKYYPLSIVCCKFLTNLPQWCHST